jgi:hypothetical protein
LDNISVLHLEIWGKGAIVDVVDRRWTTASDLAVIHMEHVRRKGVRFHL